MFEIEEIGNRELAVSAFPLQLKVYHMLGIYTDKDFNNDPRTGVDYSYLSKLLLSEQKDSNLEIDKAKVCELIYGNMSIWQKRLIINKLSELSELSDEYKYDLTLLSLVAQEISRRGFNVCDDWYSKMFDRPTYIREIDATDFLGGLSIQEIVSSDLTDDELISSLSFMDYPVIKACKILTEKGYITYWSSANSKDFEAKDREYKHDHIYVLRGEGSVIKDKKVAYILIDPGNLTDDLKQKLLLDGRCEFWGRALSHGDNGKYYGIWAEITSLDMKCDDLSKILVAKALALPKLENEKVSTRR